MQSNPKTLLIYPRFGWEWDIMHPDMPLGIAYIASMLREHNLDVKIHDCSFDKSMEDIKKAIEAYMPDVVGIEVLSINVDNAFKIAKLVKEIKKGCIVIVGGPHPSFMPEEMLDNTSIDIAVQGEGEFTALELLQKISKSEPYYDIAGITFRRNGAIKKNPRREVLRDLDKLPFPAIDLLPYNDYFKQPSIEPMLAPYTNFVTSRGCPFDCNFCQPIAKNLFGLKHRRRSPDNIIQELTILRNKYKIKSFTIVDDLFVIDESYVKEFCEKLIKAKMGFKWRCNSRVNTISYEKLKWMKKAGCIAIVFGVESGSQRMLDLMNKRITIKEINNAFELCKKAKISTMANILMGYPGETKESLEDTIKLIKDIKPEMLSVNIASPMPGSRLYDEVKAAGQLNVKQYAQFNRDFPDGIKLDTVSIAELVHYKQLAFKAFYKTLFPRLIIHPYFLKSLAYRLFSLPLEQSLKIVKGYMMALAKGEEHKRR